MKIQSQNIYFKNTPAPPPSLVIELWPPYDQSRKVQLSYYSCSQRHYIAFIVKKIKIRRAPLSVKCWIRHVCFKKSLSMDNRT